MKEHTSSVSHTNFSSVSLTHSEFTLLSLHLANKSHLEDMKTYWTTLAVLAVLTEGDFHTAFSWSCRNGKGKAGIDMEGGEVPAASSTLPIFPASFQLQRFPFTYWEFFSESSIWGCWFYLTVKHKKENKMQQNTCDFTKLENQLTETNQYCINSQEQSPKHALRCLLVIYHIFSQNLPFTCWPDHCSINTYFNLAQHHLAFIIITSPTASKAIFQHKDRWHSWSYPQSSIHLRTQQLSWYSMIVISTHIQRLFQT